MNEFLIEVLPVLSGAAAGFLSWKVLSIHRDKRERRRRESGLPPKRILPEDL